MGTHSFGTYDIDFAPGGRWFVQPTSGYIRFVDCETSAVRDVWIGQNFWIGQSYWKLKVLTSDTLLGTGPLNGAQKTVLELAVADGRVRKRYDEPHAFDAYYPYSLNKSPSRNRVILSQEKFLRVIDWTTSPPTALCGREFNAPNGPRLREAVLTPDGAGVIVTLRWASGEGRAERLNAVTGTTECRYVVPEGAPRCAVVSPDGQQVAVGTATGVYLFPATPRATARRWGWFE